VVTLHPAVSKTQQLSPDGRLLFATDPDRCCYLNKIQPLEPVLAAHDVWISGVRADQTAHRKAMMTEQPGPQGTIRYHPMIHWTARDVHDYRTKHALPSHPLEEKGYLSVGCEPCTRKFTEALDDRGGRWYGMKKKECGLHTGLPVGVAGEERD
jgi:phosphoadenosine phosphosulfate reductase